MRNIDEIIRKSGRVNHFSYELDENNQDLKEPLLNLAKKHLINKNYNKTTLNNDIISICNDFDIEITTRMVIAIGRDLLQRDSDKEPSSKKKEK